MSLEGWFVLDTHAAALVKPLAGRVARTLASLGVTAGQVTLAGAALGVASGACFYAGFQWLAVVLIVAAGVGDMLDGALARETGRTTALGGLLDLWLDRLVEVSVLIFYALAFPDVQMAVVVLAGTIILSLTVFLTMGALVDNDGHKVIPYLPGLMERTETIIFFVLFYAVPTLRHWWVYGFALLVGVTVIQRLLQAWRRLK